MSSIYGRLVTNNFKKVGRNEKCPYCKSGKKFKKCCLRKIGDATQSAFKRPGSFFKKKTEE